LKGNASYIIDKETFEDATYEQLAEKLKSRFGTEEQSSLYQSKMRIRRRAKGESLQDLYHGISRMAGLAFRGKSSNHRELAETDAFIEAFTKGLLRMRIKDKEIKDLEEALHIALLSEANPVERVVVDAADTPGPKNEYKARGAMSMEDATVAVVTSTPEKVNNDSAEKRCEKLCEVLKALVKSGKLNNDTVASPTMPQYARPPPTCFKCGDIKHFSHRCGKNVEEKKGNVPTNSKSPMKCYHCGGFKHIARASPDNKNKNNEQVNEKLPAENIRGIKGEDSRSMKEHPVYIKAYIGRKEAVCLVVTGSEKCVLPRRLVEESIIEPAGGRLFAANGTTINVMGELTLDVHVGDLTIHTIFVVSDNVTEPMLGVNWLRLNRIIWDFAQDVLIVNGEVFSLISEDEQSACRRARALEDEEAELLSHRGGYKIDH